MYAKYWLLNAPHTRSVVCSFATASGGSTLKISSACTNARDCAMRSFTISRTSTTTRPGAL